MSLSPSLTEFEISQLFIFRDCHCHLVPDVDDGVKTLEDSLRILEKWEELGMKEVWMTPHIMEDIPNQPKELNDKIQDVLSHSTGTIT